MTIIIEGPDGAGKTTLVQELQDHFPEMEIHARFCTSKGGPIPNLAEAVYKDAKGRPSNFIYDRHPLLSEYIYNTAIPTRSIRPDFLSDAMGRLRLRVARHALTVFCLPPFNEVKKNTERDAEDQMPGVVENIFDIYQQYCMHKIMWPGRQVGFDYTQHQMSWEGLNYALFSTKGKLWKDRK